MAEGRKIRALVTGGAGFLGSHLCRRLLADGRQVTAVDNLLTGSDRNIRPLSANADFAFVKHDITAPFEGEFDEIYNFACPASPVHYQSHPLETVKTSVLGTLNMLELARRCGARFIQASTSEIYGDPLVHPQTERYWGNVNTLGARSCYDEGKRCAETLVNEYRKAYRLDLRIIRIFNTYGPNMHPQDGRVVSNFIMQALRGEEITLFGDGDQTRSFQYCDDLIEAVRRFMDKPQAEVDAFSGAHGLPAPVLNLGNPAEFTIRELAELVLELVGGTGSRIVFRPLPPDDPKRRRPDIALAREFLDWTPSVPLREGLAKTVEYFRGV